MKDSTILTIIGELTFIVNCIYLPGYFASKPAENGPGTWKFESRDERCECGQCPAATERSAVGMPDAQVGRLTWAALVASRRWSRRERSRVEEVVRTLPAYASGGGSPRASRTTGSAARNMVAVSGGRSRARWRARWPAPAGCRPRRVRLPAAHLADDRGGPDGLFGAPAGGLQRRVPQEAEHGAEFGSEVGAETRGVVQLRRCVDQPTHPGGEPTAVRRHTVLAQFARSRSWIVGLLRRLGGRMAGPPRGRPAVRARGCTSDL